MRNLKSCPLQRILNRSYEGLKISRRSPKLGSGDEAYDKKSLSQSSIAVNVDVIMLRVP